MCLNLSIKFGKAHFWCFASQNKDKKLNFVSKIGWRAKHFFFQLAEGAGFEPTDHFLDGHGLANRCFEPLSQPSISTMYYLNLIIKLQNIQDIVCVHSSS